MRDRDRPDRYCQAGGGTASPGALRPHASRNSRPLQLRAAPPANFRSRPSAHGSAAPRRGNQRHPAVALRRRSENAVGLRLPPASPLRVAECRDPYLAGSLNTGKRLRPGFRSRTETATSCAGEAALAFRVFLGRGFFLRAGLFLGMDDRLVNCAAGSAETRELAIVALALQHINRRDRLPADLISRRALEDCPVHPARLALFLDIVKTAVDDRVERIELGRGPAVGCPATASRRPAATALTLPLALTAT